MCFKPGSEAWPSCRCCRWRNLFNKPCTSTHSAYLATVGEVAREGALAGVGAHMVKEVRGLGENLVAADHRARILLGLALEAALCW